MGYIVEVDMFADGNWHQSGSKGLNKVTFNTFAEALEAKEKFASENFDYRIAPIDAPATPKQYMVEIKFADSDKWEPSGNRGLFNKTFATEAAANDAIDEHGSMGANYRVTPVVTEEVNTFATKVDGVIFGLSMRQQFLTSDMVQAELAEVAGNRAGSFFKGNLDVKKVAGRTVRSRRTERKGGQISVYRSLHYTGPKVTITQFIKGYNAKGVSAGQ